MSFSCFPCFPRADEGGEGRGRLTLARSSPVWGVALHVPGPRARSPWVACGPGGCYSRDEFRSWGSHCGSSQTLPGAREQQGAAAVGPDENLPAVSTRCPAGASKSHQLARAFPHLCVIDWTPQCIEWFLSILLRGLVSPWLSLECGRWAGARRSGKGNLEDPKLLPLWGLAGAPFPLLPETPPL